MSKPPISLVDVSARVIIGRTKMTLSEVKRLHSGDVITLSTKVSAPVDLYCDSKLIGNVEIMERNGMFWVKVANISNG